jgi:hypothetical protein
MAAPAGADANITAARARPGSAVATPAGGGANTNAAAAPRCC